MKKIVSLIVTCFTLITLSSCEKDEGKLPNLSFKTASGYTSSNVSLAGSTHITIGIDASKAEKKDVLKQFNISKSVNGGTATSVYDKALSGGEGDSYSYDLSAVVDTTSGQTCKYTFTVTNRDGLTNQVSLTVTTN